MRTKTKVLTMLLALCLLCSAALGVTLVSAAEGDFKATTEGSAAYAGGVTEAHLLGKLDARIAALNAQIAALNEGGGEVACGGLCRG